MLGTKLAHYQITSHLGTGGMGEVYQATDTRLGRSVAIKLLPEAFTHDVERSARFEREARVLASLNHPGIAAIHGIEESGGRKFLVMELVPGETLADRLRSGPIPVDEALGIAEEIAVALAAAHEKGIIHRDLKPANIKLTDDGSVKVLDFGLARMDGKPNTGAVSEESPTFSTALSQPGVIYGTAAYMSPEQARGKSVDLRSDVWSFGVVLYEMVTALRPFRGADIGDMLASVLKDPPDLSAVPQKVRRLLEACLQKDPKRRLQAIGDYHLLLTEAVAPRVSRVWAVVACTIALAMAVLGWKHFTEAPSPVQNLRYQLTPVGDLEFAHFQLSTDGRNLAFVAARSGAANRLYVRAMDSLDDREFPDTDGATYPFWSPDGKHIAFFSQGKLKQVAADGGPITSIADAPDARGGAWGPNGTIVFAPAVVGTLFRVSVSNDGVSKSSAAPMNLPREGAGARDSLRFPAFLPDSDRFFYTIEADKREGEGIYVGSLNGTPPVRILPDFSTTRFVRAAGSGTNGFILFRRGTTLMAQPFDAAALKTTGEAFPLAAHVPDSGNTSNTAFTVSANGTLIFLSDTAAQQEREILWVDRSGKPGKVLIKQTGITDFALSPDGNQLAYSLASQRVQGDLWLQELARGTSQRFTFGPFSALSPVWSPDNASIAFTAYPEDALYRKATQTSVKEKSLGVTGTNTFGSNWSADGKFLAYSQSGSDTKGDLWLLPLDGKSKPIPFRRTPFSESGGQISPDAGWMAYMSDASGQTEVYIESLNPGGVESQISTGGGEAPRWGRNGKELYFVSGMKLMAVDVKPGSKITVGTPHELFHEPGLLRTEGTMAYQPNSDGTQFLVARPVGAALAVKPLTVVTNWQAAYARE